MKKKIYKYKKKGNNIIKRISKYYSKKISK